MQQSRQFRFTRRSSERNVFGLRCFMYCLDLAPTHAILAFKRALDELHEEGGVQGRARRFDAHSIFINEQRLDPSLLFRYQNNNKRIRSIMHSLGFRELIKAEYQTYIITSYYYPPPPFHFETFYNKLSEKSTSEDAHSRLKVNANLSFRSTDLSWENNGDRLFSHRQYRTAL